ncbi:MAG: bifunctional phosphoglucose/phosphomannose isomerase [Candidatus Eisenbacteria bacterium]|nr:bifunctional phosphoglucose/phosphomannose isomerase [Candidatus Eisenbacteria bacterium]
MNILEDLAGMREIDRGGMRAHIESFPNHLVRALEIGRGTELGLSGEGVTAIAVLGMGGSAIAGDLVAGLLADELRVPMRSVRGYELPGFVDPATLVFVSSYSGNTEETLAAYDAADATGARIACLTSGGEVARLAGERGHDVIRMPPGFPPRAALAFSFVPMLVSLWRLGLAGDPREEIEDAVSVCRDTVARCGLERPVDRNPAKEIAAWLAGKVPVVYGATPRASAIATRWAGQLSENAKTIAHANELPEMNHNEIVGWGGEEPLSGRGAVIFLRDAEDPERVSRRADLTRDEIRASGAPVRDVESRGETRLARMLSLVGLGDFVSLYLAFLKCVDPTPVEPIDRLKSALSN